MGTDGKAAVSAIRAGRVAILPTDTVYGLVCDASREESVRNLNAIKQRPSTIPCALVAAELDQMLAAVPELAGAAAAVVRALLPGPYTLVVPNPAERFRWLCGERPSSIGIRVPSLPPEAREVLEEVGVVAATSANLHGGPDPSRVEEIPTELRSRVGAIVDVGPLPGTPSTVLDLTNEPRVLREGAVATAVALERVRAVLG
jgi:L-threonylcarbamoyladenylate synthase